jgi:ketosteroid isomerase-like protein
MSEENVEVVRKSFAAMGRGDLDALFDLYDEDIKFEPHWHSRRERRLSRPSGSASVLRGSKRGLG